MTIRVHRQADVTIDARGHVRRRDFLRAVPVAAAGGGLVSWSDALALDAHRMRRSGMACILLWMQGGPSQFETFSPQPGVAADAPQSITTNVSGIRISENLPEVAGVMDKLCLIRSMTSKEGSHPRASYLMHTGYVPTASVKYPSLGAHVAHRIGDAAADLPGFVRIGRVRSSDNGGFLGVEYDPFTIAAAGPPPENTRLPTSSQRARRRLGLLNELEADVANDGFAAEVKSHRKLYEKTSRMMMSDKMVAFDLDREPARVRSAYGDSAFGKGCLLARRLVEAGVTFIEVSAGNWDTHQDNFARTKDLCGQIDRPLAQLLRDLEQRGRLDSTMVVWTGEFGRTPRVNGRGGRDHFPRAFTSALAGGKVRGGQVIGATEANGAAVTDRPVQINDLLRTVYHGLGIDADEENMSGAGRPVRIADDGQVVSEVWGTT